MKFRLYEAQSGRQATLNRKFKKRTLNQTMYDETQFLVHHKDNTLTDGVKLTTAKNCVLVQKFPGDVNVTHALVTNVIRSGGLREFIEDLSDMVVLHIDEDGNIEEQKFTEYLKSL